ncbi:MAG: ABC transporter permease subunit [Thermosipho sp. (in: Bacteria)]|nr:ABC transporter permease subunit [Thermosipho sp. (in: thermotogales)]
MKKEWIDMKVRAIVIFIVMLGLFLSLAPLQNWTINILEENSQAVQKYMNPTMIESLKNWDFYIYSQWFGKNFGQFVPIIALIIAFPLFSREYENGTIEFLLTRASRKKVFLNKLTLSLLVLTIQLTILSLLPLIYSVIFSKEFTSIYTFKFLIHCLIGGIFWYSVTLLFSSFFNDQVKPILASIVALGVSTVLGILRPLKFLNTFLYILGTSIFNYNSINWTYSIVLLILSIFLIIASYLIFLRKEM